LERKFTVDSLQVTVSEKREGSCAAMVGVGEERKGRQDAGATEKTREEGFLTARTPFGMTLFCDEGNQKHRRECPRHEKVAKHCSRRTASEGGPYNGQPKMPA
jgi:hypothetical protein